MKNLAAVSRRNFLKVGAAALATPYIIRPSFAQTNQLTFVTWGGTYREAIEKSLVQPFTAETGIKVNIIDTPDLAKVRAQVMTGNVEWDVFDAPSSLGTSGSKEGYWEPLDPSLFKADDLFVKPAADRVPLYTYAGGLAWDENKFGEGKRPETFEEYFDVERFPGRRSFRDRPSETFEAALIADGVKPADLYPIDVDRAFKMLDRVKPHVASWIAATPQTVTLLQTGEIDFSYTYSARVKGVNANGGNLGFSFKQTLNASEWLAVLKGAPNKENAMKFVEFCLREDPQAQMASLLGYTPAMRPALAKVSEEDRKWLPDLENPNNVIMDDEWWGDNFETLTRRFKEWQLV